MAGLDIGLGIWETQSDAVKSDKNGSKGSQSGRARKESSDKGSNGVSSPQGRRRNQPAQKDNSDKGSNGVFSPQGRRRNEPVPKDNSDKGSNGVSSPQGRRRNEPVPKDNSDKGSNGVSSPQERRRNQPVPTIITIEDSDDDLAKATTATPGSEHVLCTRCTRVVDGKQKEPESVSIKLEKDVSPAGSAVNKKQMPKPATVEDAPETELTGLAVPFSPASEQSHTSKRSKKSKTSTNPSVVEPAGRPGVQKPRVPGLQLHSPPPVAPPAAPTTPQRRAYFAMPDTPHEVDAFGPVYGRVPPGVKVDYSIPGNWLHPDLPPPPPVPDVLEPKAVKHANNARAGRARGDRASSISSTMANNGRDDEENSPKKKSRRRPVKPNSFLMKMFGIPPLAASPTAGYRTEMWAGKPVRKSNWAWPRAWAPEKLGAKDKNVRREVWRTADGKLCLVRAKK